jgi:hypothetical protein
MCPRCAVVQQPTRACPRAIVRPSGLVSSLQSLPLELPPTLPGQGLLPWWRREYAITQDQERAGGGNSRAGWRISRSNGCVCGCGHASPDYVARARLHQNRRDGVGVRGHRRCAVGPVCVPAGRYDGRCSKRGRASGGSDARPVGAAMAISRPYPAGSASAGAVHGCTLGVPYRETRIPPEGSLVPC